MESAAATLPSAVPLEWEALQALAAPEPDRVQGPPSSQATLRLFGHAEADVRVTLYRDHHAWCPYCQKVWLWLEERRVPYRVRKVSMHCYGEKESWYRALVPSGMLPALELDGRRICESDRILEELESVFGPVGAGMGDPRVVPLRRLERRLFRAWCQWLCQSGDSVEGQERAAAIFEERAADLAAALEVAAAAGCGPFLLGDFSSADLVFVPFLERMNASLAYYKGVLLRDRHPAIDRWFRALEQRQTYLGTQSDFHTHAHDLPPQMGGCVASTGDVRLRLAHRIDEGPWPIVDPPGADPETSQREPAEAAALALSRVLRHRNQLIRRGDGPLAPTPEKRERALRCALSRLLGHDSGPPPSGTAAWLRSLRDRISVPRDMPLHAARRLRRALEETARLDGRDPFARGPALTTSHRRDQDPRPFLEAAAP